MNSSRKSKKAGGSVGGDAARATRSFRTGGSMAVRIPKEFQLAASDLTITKVADGLLISAAPPSKGVADWWAGWKADPDFMAGGRQQPAMQDRALGI
jgi:virulence-associated protein VagC